MIHYCVGGAIGLCSPVLLLIAEVFSDVFEYTHRLNDKLIR